MSVSLHERFCLSPLIRWTLISVYLALVLPLPLMAPPELKLVLWSAAPIGFALVLAMLSEQVNVDEKGMSVGHPTWCSWLIRRGWQLQWQEIKRLVPVGTSQGGTVYYLTTINQGLQLLPQRIEKFDRFLSIFEQRTGLKTGTIQRLTPPWTYQLLCGLAVGMLTLESVVAMGIRWGLIVIPEGYPG